MKRPNLFTSVIQQWQGRVLEVHEDIFQARLVKVVGEGEDLWAEIYIHAVDKRYRPLIKPNAIFDWEIGMRENGEAVSIIRFRQLTSFTALELAAAKTRATEYRVLLAGEIAEKT